MNALQQRRTACIVLLLVLSSHPACAFPVTFSDQGTDAKSGGVPVDGGDLTVQVWDSMTGGTMLYGETFTGAIVNGSWNVILGGSGDLELEYGLTYYKEYQINGQDLDFTTPSTGTTERLPFTSPLGVVNMSKLMQVSQKPSIDAANLTSGIIPDARINGSRWVNYSSAACVALTGSADLCDGSDATSAGGAQQPNIDAANMTSGVILNARLNASYVLNQTFAAASYSPLAHTHVSTYLNYSGTCASGQIYEWGVGCVSMPSGGASQPNIDAANITSGTVLNARYNMSFLAQASDVTGLWGNASNQDARIVSLENAPASQPYWIDLSGRITSNASINGGNVHASGKISSGTSNASGLFTVAFGTVNNANGSYSAVSGGSENVVYGPWSSVSGGRNNRIGNINYAVVSGGENNYAGEWYSLVSGGGSNNASGVGSAVFSGRFNLASATYSVVSGGLNNTASNQFSTIPGGMYLIASGLNSFAFGNSSNATGTWSVAFGQGVQATALNSWALGAGFTNPTAGSFQVGFGAATLNVTDNLAMVLGDVNASGRVCDGAGNCLNNVGSASVTPYWVSLSGSITSNASISGGNVNVTGNLTVSDRMSMFGGTASGLHSVALGQYNNATAAASAVLGGSSSTASAANSVVAGGLDNRASGISSVVSGGNNNNATNMFSLVAGGAYNTAQGQNSAVLGGTYNLASGASSVVLGGSNVNASGAYSLAAGLNVSASASNSFAFGQHYTNPSPDTFTVGFTDITLNVSDNLVRVAGDVNASGRVCDGAGNCLNNVGSASVVPYWTNQFGSITSNASISGGNVNVTGNLSVAGRLASVKSSATGDSSVALGSSNNASGNFSGVLSGYGNTAAGNYAVAAGGWSNDAAGGFSAVSGGENNMASEYSFVGGGLNNAAGGWYSAIAGGYSNDVSGWWSSILGGFGNTANGNYSIAGGNGSRANWTNSVAVGSGAVASGRASYSLGQNTLASAGNSYALGRDVSSTNAGAISLGISFVNPVPNSFAVGFGDVTVNVTDNLLMVIGDVNATGRVCDGSGNCITASGMSAVTEQNITDLWVNATVQESHIGLLWANASSQEGRITVLEAAPGGASQPNIDAANITSGVIANARYNLSYLFNKGGVLADGQYCRYNGSLGTIDCNSPGAGSTTVTDQNVTDLWLNASVQENHIRALLASNSSLWANASNQDQRITSLEGASGSTPYWVTRNSVTTSNSTLNGGNVNVTGYLSVNGLYRNLALPMFVPGSIKGADACSFTNNILPNYYFACSGCRDTTNATVSCTAIGANDKYCICVVP